MNGSTEVLSLHQETFSRPERSCRSSSSAPPPSSSKVRVCSPPSLRYFLVAGFGSKVCFHPERSPLTPTLLFLRSLSTSTLRPLQSELQWRRSTTGPGQMSFPSLHADADK